MLAVGGWSASLCADASSIDDELSPERVKHTYLNKRETRNVTSQLYASTLQSSCIEIEYITCCD